MNIEKVNFTNVQSTYKLNKIESRTIIDKNIDNVDKVEISELGKYLNQINLDKGDINIKRVEELRQKIGNKTYVVNSRDLAKKIIKSIRSEK